MTDCASPIIIDGRHYANVFIGQFHTEVPDMEFFRKQAVTWGFPVDDYLKAVREAPVMDERKLPAILDFSKIEAGKLDIESVEFELDDVLEKVTSMTALKAEEKGLELLFTRGAGVPDWLVGDPLRLSQILINLTNNAMKFTEKGEVVISTDLVEKNDRQITLRFSVRDTSIELTKEQLGRLFQSFSQADGSTTRKYGGTGLGLAICKRLSELMGGTIWVESEPGKGSSFIFTIVFGHSTEERRPRLSPIPDLRGTKALVVTIQRLPERSWSARSIRWNSMSRRWHQGERLSRRLTGATYT